MEKMPNLLKSKLLGMGTGFLPPYESKKPQFEIFNDSKQPVHKFRWHIWMSSDIVAASSQGYTRRELCLQNAKSVMNHLLELNKEGKLI